MIQRILNIEDAPADDSIHLTPAWSGVALTAAGLVLTVVLSAIGWAMHTTADIAEMKGEIHAIYAAMQLDKQAPQTVSYRGTR